MSSHSSSFQATLVEPLSFGHILQICGKAQQHANRIFINLSQFASSTEANNKVDLQILLDFSKKQITFTQLPTAETSNGVAKDLTLAEFLNDFKFYIMLGETIFFIALNNKPFVSFNYAQNIRKLQIQKLEIVGRLEYIKQLDHHKYFAHTWPPIQISDDYLDFSNDQPVPFKPGHIMTISARLQGNNKGKFVIQFRHAHDNKRPELHICVNFNTRKIIRNSKCRQADDKLIFGKEETDDAAFPFQDFSKPFKMAVAFCETEFRVAKDGEYLFSYKYRVPNVLQFIVGAKIFGTNGLSAKVWGVNHRPLEDDLCQSFEQYSI